MKNPRNIMPVDREIRVLALMEAATLGGPPKNLIEFAGRAREPLEGLPKVRLAIATFQRGAGPPNVFVKAARDAGVEVFVLSERRRFDARPRGQLSEIAAAFRPDIIQSHNVKSHFLVRSLKLHREIPWIAFNHGYTATDWKDRLYNQLDRVSLPAAFRLVAVCQAFARGFERLGVAPDRIRVQHNSVRPFARPTDEVVFGLRQSLGIGERRVVLSVGRLSGEKGHADLLRAFAIGRERAMLENCCLVVVGDGPENEPLRRLSAQLGLADAVHFAGHQRDVRPFYSLATMLALPSYSEGSPNVVLEAMAAGVPVVATAVGGVPEILINQVTGLTVPARDPAAMADGMVRLLRDPQLRSNLIAAARECVATKYSPENHCRSWIGLYQEALSAWGARGAAQERTEPTSSS